MKTIRRPNQYLQLRGEVWHYIRRVPAVVMNMVGHDIISRSLETDSVSLARRRRDTLTSLSSSQGLKHFPKRLCRKSVKQKLYWVSCQSHQ